MNKKAIINKNYCVACGTCLSVCPLQLITIDQGVFAQIDYNRCVGCGKCAKSCPASVINIKQIKVGE